MKPVLELIRKSQWRWDFITASHGAAFHAPIESQRVLADGLFLAMEAETKLNSLSDKNKIAKAFVMPDITSKDKAQKVIGLDMALEKKKKAEFMKNIAPQWLQKAKANQRLITKN